MLFAERNLIVKKLATMYEKKLKPHVRKILLGLLAFFVLFSLAGFFLLPPIVKLILTKQLSKSLNREVAINQLKINPYNLKVMAKRLTVKGLRSDEPFVSCEEIFLNLQSISVFKMALILEEIRLTKPYIMIARNKDLSYNFSDLLEDKEDVAAKKQNAKPLKFSINNIIIENGSIDFLDGPKETHHTVRDVKIGIPFLSNIPSDVERFVQPHFSAKIDNANYSLDGKTKPFAESLETHINVDIKDLNVPHYLTYVPLNMRFKVVSAVVDTTAKVSFVQTEEKRPSLAVEGTVTAKNIVVKDAEGGPLVRLPLLNISIAPSHPLSGLIHLSNLSIESPELEIRRDEKGDLNTQSFLIEETKKRVAAREAGETPPLSLNIDTITLSKGKISFVDLSGGEPFKTILNPVDLKVDHFSNDKGKKTAYALSFRTEANETIKGEGEFSADPLMVDGGLGITSVVLKKYAPFYKDIVFLDIEDGRLDVSTRYKIVSSRGKETEVNLSGISATVKSLRLKKRGEKENFFTAPNLSVSGTALNLVKKEITIGNFSTENGELLVKRSSNGDLNLLTLTPSPPAPKESPKDPKGAEKPLVPAEPWVVSVKQMLIDKYTVRLQDETTRRPATLVAQNLRLKGENISSAGSSKAGLDLSLLLNGKGGISVLGTVDMEPLAADLRVGLKGIELVPFQPYFMDKVEIRVTGGAISCDGRLSIASNDKKEIKTAYRGKASVANFSSIDRLSGEDLLKLESLSMSDLNVAYAPLSIDIKGVSLSDFYTLVLVNSQGKINLQEVLTPRQSKAEKSSEPVRQEPATASVEKKESQNNIIKIDEVTLQGGTIDFKDESITPEFSTHLSEIGGRISGLSADQDTTADVELRGKLNDYAPLEITGKINPLRDDLFVDLRARIKDLDLSPATPYSGKYAGYTIERGKLAFDVSYSIVEGKLDSQNNIVIDQFSFGEKVDSPQATNLPVKLAVALLKNRSGEIRLDLPVAGSLDDPKFSVWRVIGKILLNLVAKAATSPFALLGAVFGGGGEELRYVEFDDGSAKITESNVNKLNIVSTALQDRPSLRLDIRGHVDVEKDREGLKQVRFERKLKLQKLNEIVKEGQPAIPVDEVQIEAQDYEKYLKRAYRREKFPKPTNFIGLTKDLPAPEMEKLMLTHIEITVGDLRTLASERAMKVREEILKSGKVEPERVFIVEPKSLAPEKTEKLRNSRVELRLGS